MKITIKQLEIFVAVAKIGNMTLAAEDLHLTQSACSMALTTLEAQLSDPLFDRQGKKLVLNERGKILFPKAANILAEIQEAQDLMLEKKGKSFFGSLVIGASTTIGNYMLPAIIGNFVKIYPKIKIKLRIADTKQVIQEILRFNLDLGLIEGSCHSDEIKVLPWKKDPLIIVASPNHPLSKSKQISIQTLLEASWVLREPGSSTRTKLEEALGINLTALFELNHTEAIKQAIHANLGIGCLQKATVDEELKRGELVQLKTPSLKLSRDFSILLHKSKHCSLLLTTFIKRELL